VWLVPFSLVTRWARGASVSLEAVDTGETALSSSEGSGNREETSMDKSDFCLSASAAK